MARVYRKSAALEAKYTQYNILFIIGVVLAAIGILLHFRAIFTHEAFLDSPFGAFLFVIPGGFLIANFKGKRDAVKAGLDAENKTAEFIAQLPDTYTGFANARITYEGYTSEVDMIVTGPNGVFVIETKSRTGYIYGDVDNKYLSQDKGRVETYTHKFYNPMKQVGTHVFRLSGFLKQHGIDVWVQGAVFFSNADLDLSGVSKIPYFDTKNELTEYILTRRPKTPITPEMLSRINQILM